MGVVDFHAHILPGIDDGSRCMEESIKMLQQEADQGVTCVVATPHFYANHQRPEEFLEQRARAEETLRKEMVKYPDLPEILVGAEVYYFPGMSNSEFLLELAIGGTRYIMIEMPQTPWRPSMFEELEMIRHRLGLIPIVAHLDRYIRPFHTYGIPEQLARMGMLVQVNGSAFLRKDKQRLALRMLKKGQIQLLGSDCHDPMERKPNLQNAVAVVEKKLGRDSLTLVRAFEERILCSIEGRTR